MTPDGRADVIGFAAPEGGVNQARNDMASNEIETLAQEIRKALPPNQQEQVFKLAAEAGYLTALADGVEDEGERAALVSTIESLSQGLVIEWEVEQVLEKAWTRVQTEGTEAYAEAIGLKLKELDAAEAGLFVAAVVALATAGLDKSEAQMLQTIGAAAGLEKKRVGEIVKRAR